MSAPASPPAQHTVTFVDRWLDALRAHPATARRAEFYAAAIVTLLAGVLRFFGLNNPHAIVFDETYYVKDAWSQWNLGYPSQWPANANGAFEHGDTDDFGTTGSFVVHPPLGKWLIGAGMWLFGADSSFGWRFATALIGTLLVLLVWLTTRTLTRSAVLATIAGFLLAIDGLGIVLSRVALLDVIVTFFILLAFWFVLLDRDQIRPRLDALGSHSDGEKPRMLGPLLWNRPWLLAAGLAAGAATATKWSGLYALAALGIWVLVSEAVARQAVGIRLWYLDALRQGLWAAVLMVPSAFIVYLASWGGWIMTSGGYDRTGITSQAWSWLPEPLRNLWTYHMAMYDFNVNLHASHPYASPAWQWPLLLRPTSMYWQQSGDSVQAISSIPNPLIWYAGIAAVVYLVVRFVRRWDAQSAFVLTGIAGTYVPWLFYPDRTIFQFYTIVMLPFLVMAIAIAARDIAGSREVSLERRRTGVVIVLCFLGASTVLSAFWYPVWTAIPVPYEFWRLHNWMFSWI